MQKYAKVGIIAAIVIIAGVLASPLFYETEVDEPLPIALNNIEEGLTMEKFSNMDEVQRQVLVEKMPENVKDMIMKESAAVTRSISEDMENMMQDSEQGPQIIKTGQFEGLAGHHAQGTAKIIQGDGMTFLRFENFEVTNGPDLRVYITDGGNINNGIHLEKLKGSRGNQNYVLEGVDLGIYDTVVIYCQPFGVYFGEAPLA